MTKTPDAVSNPAGYVQSQGGGRAASDAGLRTHLLNHGRRKFLPEAFDGPGEEAPHQSTLTVDLGGERLRTVVRQVLDPDTVVVEVTRLPFARNHPFRLGDMVGAKRVKGPFGESWEALTPRALQQAQDAAQAQALEAAQEEARQKRRAREEKAAQKPVKGKNHAARRKESR